jgi:glycosyltransferase involved in cell wall biosynthesis
MKPILTILIPTLEDRKQYFYNLIEQLRDQQCEELAVLSASDNREITTGAKRNALLDMCTTEWCVFIDDDDQIASDYVEEHLNILRNKPQTDAIGFKGTIWTNGSQPHEFIHQHGNEYKEDKSSGVVKYLRPIMHINCIRTSIARQIRYPDLTFAEDYDYGNKLAQSGLIKNAEFINKTMYHYLYRPNK